MSTPLQPSDRDPATSLSEKSNAWTMNEREAIFQRRQSGESWDTIWPSYPNRSKHAMQQQYSIMKKQALPKTPLKPNRIPRKASTHTLPSTVNGVDKNAKDKSSSGHDGTNSDAEIHDKGSKDTGKARLRRANSDEPVRPRRRNSAVQQRSSKRIKRNAKGESDDDVDDEPSVHEEPVSARPKRTTAGGVNYSLLAQDNLFDESQDPAATGAEEEPERKSKIVKLRTNPAKTHLGNLLEQAKKKNRRTASVDNGTEAPKTPNEKEAMSAQRKSTRVKKVIDGSPGNTDIQEENQPETTTPRKRKPRMLANLEIQNQSLKAASANASPRTRKRKLSSAVADTTQSSPAIVNRLAQDEGSKEPEPKRRKGKLRPDLGFLPNGQPRQRRRRRTREEMLRDEQSPKTVTTRQREKYHFPYLDGYSGRAPPDLATITARQDELERQNSASIPTTDHDTALSMGSLDGDSSLESSPEPDPKPNTTNVSTSVEPATDNPPSANATEQSVVAVGADPTTPGHLDPSLGIPEIIFFPGDLAKGRENALKLRTFLEAEKRAHLTTSEAALSQHTQRMTQLQQELVEKDTQLQTSQDALTQKTQHITTLEQELTAQKAQLTTSEASLAQEKARVADLSKTSQRIPDLENQISALKKQWSDRGNEVAALKTSMSEQVKEYKENLLIKEKELKAESKALKQMETFASALEKKCEAADLKLQSLPSAPPPVPSLPPQTPTHQIPPFNQNGHDNPIHPLRNAHIRLAGHIRTTTRSHSSLKQVIEQLSKDLDEDEITMRKVKGVAKGLVDEVGRVGEGLEGCREGSDEVKGLVVGLIDRFGGG